MLQSETFVNTISPTPSATYHLVIAIAKKITIWVLLAPISMISSNFSGAPPASKKPARLWLREAMRLTPVCPKWQLALGRNRWNGNSAIHIAVIMTGQACMDGCVHTVHTQVCAYSGCTKPRTKTNMPTYTHTHTYEQAQTEAQTTDCIRTHAHSESKL